MSDDVAEDFALLEVAYTIVRLIQEFPLIEVPADEASVRIGEERQKINLVLGCADGCRVVLGKGS